MFNTDTQIAAGRAIQRRTGKNFHVATRVFPERVRDRTYVLYGFFRVADDVVDDPDGPPPAEQRRRLAEIRAAALGEKPTDDPVIAAFYDLAAECDIADEEVESFLDAMAQDVDRDYYETYADLESYMRGSAVAVGTMMLDAMDVEDRERARPHAAALAEAFQLTNFLRDVREDVVDHGRVYLPLETLERFDVDPSEVESLSFSRRFAAAMTAELERTECRYREGVAGIRYLPADCQFAVLLAAVVYAEHHRLIRNRGYDVLSERPTLSTGRRLGLAARTWLHWRRTRDPVATFEAVSAVPRTDESGESDAAERRRPVLDPTGRAIRASRRLVKLLS
jgi:phytoene synthase